MNIHSSLATVIYWAEIRDSLFPVSGNFNQRNQNVKKGQKMKRTVMLTVVLGLFLGLFSWATALGQGVDSWDIVETVGWWHFDEGSGNIAHDASPYRNDGDCQGTVWTSGIDGWAVQFVGPPDPVVKVPDDPSLDFDDLQQGQGFMIDFWMKKYQTPPQYDAGLVSKQAGANGYQATLGVQENIQVGLYNSGVGYGLVSNTTISDNDWHHIVMVWDGSTIYIYIDDMTSPDNSTYVGEFTLGDTWKWLDIGNHWPGDNRNPFDGVIDEVRISVINGTVVQVSPHEFTFNLQLDTTAEKVLSLECVSVDTVFFSLTSDADWISFLPDSGYLLPDSSVDVSVTFDGSGLPLGQHQGTIFLDVVVPYGPFHYDIPVTVSVFSLDYTHVCLIPDSLPITIPPEGGNFRYWAQVYNSSDFTYRFDIWIDATLPDGSTYGPISKREFFRFRPHYYEARYPTQNVPAYAPPGEYSYNFKMGVFPDQVDYQDSFSFTKLEAGLLPDLARVTSWDLYGWDEELVTYLAGDQTETGLVPTEYSLSQNYPNPFNATTIFNYQLPVTNHLKLEIYNLLGQKVATLVDGEQQAGYRSVVWDASEVSSGLYFYKLTAGDYTETRRMMLVK